MSNKLLIISGPTATGKTTLAVKIAKKYHGELISADSRQIYKGLDIGVGKDHPPGTAIHLIGLITPDQRFSVSQFQSLALQRIAKLQSKNILPIVVGCSGLYIDSIINQNYTTFSTKPNKLLRTILGILPTKFLQKVYLLLDKKSLNNSDFNNPRRLIRKIELKLSHRDVINHVSIEKTFDVLHLSLTAPNKYLYPRIDARVDARLKIGHLDELKKLLSRYKWTDPGLRVSCYSVFQNNTSEKALKLWKYAEHSDARHQKTWFKRYLTATFVDVSSKKRLNTTINKVTKWYNES